MLLRPLIALAVFVTAMPATAQTDDLPEGRGKDKVLQACGGCHELARVTAQRRSKAHWNETVDDMIARGAQVADVDYDDVVAYLGKNFGLAVNSSAAKP